MMATEAVPNETENDLRTYQIVYQTASQETVTEWHHERQLGQLRTDDHRDFAVSKITVEGMQIGIE